MNRKLSDKKLGVYALITWILLILYMKNDPKIFKKDQIGNVETLKKSQFARGMFMDIGALSTIVSYWILNDRKTGIFRYPFGIITMFIGSFGALPYIFIRSLFNKKEPSK